MNQPIKEEEKIRFWSHVMPSGEGCWEWVWTRSGPSHASRPSFSIGGRGHTAARVAWLIERGDIPAKMLVCHTCDNPNCVRPSHLFLGTRRDNALDASTKGRFRYVKKGFGAPRRTVKEIGKSSPVALQILATLRMARYTQAAIARRFGVSRQRVHQIAKWMYCHLDETPFYEARSKGSPSMRRRD